MATAKDAAQLSMYLKSNVQSRARIFSHDPAVAIRSDFSCARVRIVGSNYTKGTHAIRRESEAERKE